MKKKNTTVTLLVLLGVFGVACAGGWRRASQAADHPSAAHDTSRSEVTGPRDSYTGQGEDMKTVFNEIERESQSFTVSGTPQINIENFEGSVKVSTWDKPEVTVNAVKTAIDKQALAGIRFSAAQRGGGVTVETKFTQPLRVIRLGGTHMHTKGAYVELEIVVPHNANLRVTSGNGILSVAGVNGEVNLRTEHGPIDVNDGRGRLSAFTNNGLVSIVNFEGEVDASEMGRDGIVLEGRFAQLKALTGGGPISLALPADVNANIEANTRNVVNEGLNPTEEPTSTREVRRLKLGTGGPLFKLRINSGTLTLRLIGGARASAGAK